MSVDDEDEAANELRATRHVVIAPQCCEGMRRCKTIFIATEEENGDKPYWYLHTGSIYKRDRVVENDFAAWIRSSCTDNFEPRPTHCPFCGTALPAIVEAERREPFHDGDDGYCNTCSERSMNCVCWPPWSRWKPANTGESQ